MNAYFFKMNKQDRDNILDQHKQVYDGYVTRYNKENNETPLYVQDFANDKNGITLNNKGTVKNYTNMNINENMLDRIGDGPTDLKNGTVDFSDLPEDDYVSYGNFEDDMSNNLDQYEYDIEELEDYSADELGEGFDDHDIKRSRMGIDYSEEEFPEYNEYGSDEVNQDLSIYDYFDSSLDGYYDEDGEEFDDFEIGEGDDSLIQNIQESLDMFKRFKKYN